MKLRGKPGNNDREDTNQEFADRTKRREGARVTLRTKIRTEGLEKKRQVSVSDQAANVTLDIKQWLDWAIPGEAASLNRLAGDPKADCFQKIITHLGSPDATNASHAAGAISEFCTKEWRDVVARLVEDGAVPVLVRGLAAKASPIELRKKFMTALGNIAADAGEWRNLILSLGTLEHILRILQSAQDPHLTRDAVWAVANLTRGRPIPQFHHVATALPALSRFMWHSNSDVVVDACWAISYISDGPADRVESILQMNLLERLRALASSPDLPKAQTPAIRTLCNVVCGDERQCQMAFDFGVLDLLVGALAHEARDVRKDVAWALSNVLSMGEDWIKMVMSKPPAMQTFIHMLGHAEPDVKKEALHCISNICHLGNSEQVDHVVGLGCMPPLLAAVRLSDRRQSMLAIDALYDIMRNDTGRKYWSIYVSLGGEVIMEDAGYKEEEDVSVKAWDFIEKWGNTLQEME